MPVKCKGREGRPCTFGRGGGACRTGGGHTQCMWCSSSRLEAACDGRVGRHILVRTFGQMCPQQQENARCLVPSAYRAVFDKLIAERARCGGWDGTTCIFAQTAAGGPANLQKQRAACLFCDPPRLSETCSTVTGRGRVLADASARVRLQPFRSGAPGFSGQPP